MPDTYTDPKALPASFIQSMSSDPADSFEGAPPLFGRPAIPHIFTVVGRYGSQGRAYSFSDEALRHSRENAELMRTECGIMECLEARQRGTALLKWHIEPEDKDSQEQKDLAAEMTAILEETPRFVEMRRNLLESLWYGRYATFQQFSREQVRGNWRTVIKKWEPRHGDKLVFRYDDGTFEYNPDQIGIRVGAGYQLEPNGQVDFRGNPRRKIEATQFGLAYWFDDYERKTIAVHKHMIEDGPWEDPRAAGSIHGVGIRSRIYWTWYAMQECLHNLLTYLERSALGIEIWRYPAHNPKAEQQTRTAAENRIGNGRTIVLVPVPAGEDAEQYGVQHIEPGMGGVEAVKNIIVDYFGHKIKRYVLGQTLTSEAEATGLGSGVADAHMATYHDIVRFDARGLEETITTDILRPMQIWNFPLSQHIKLKFHIDTEAEDMEQRLEAYERGWTMGLKVKAQDLYDIIGASAPEEDDETLENPQTAQPPEGAMGGIPGAGMLGGQMAGNDGARLGATSQDMSDPRNAQWAKERFQYSVLRSNIDEAAREVAEPSEAQRDTGNYKKGHVRIQGLPVTIETPRGGWRYGSYGRRKMTCHYGYLKRTEGADGDHVDVFLGPEPESEIVFVIDQCDAGGSFDEHKVMLGWTTAKEAKEAYLSNYPSNWRCGEITPMDMPTFKSWLSEGKLKKPAAAQRLVYAARNGDGFADSFTRAYYALNSRYASRQGNLFDSSGVTSKTQSRIDWEEEKHPRDDGGKFAPIEGRTPNKKHEMEIVVFDPTQIKSATGNAGTFDPSDNRITHSARSCLLYDRTIYQLKADRWHPVGSKSSPLTDTKAEQLVDDGDAEYLSLDEAKSEAKKIIARLKK